MRAKFFAVYFGLLFFIGSAISAETASAKTQADKRAEENFFKTFMELKKETEKCKELIDCLSELKNCSVKERCEAAQDTFSVLWGKYNPNYPVWLIYIDRDGEVQANSVIWGDKKTPWLYGAHHMWVTIISEYDLSKYEVKAAHTVLREYPVNPLAGILKKFSVDFSDKQKERQVEATKEIVQEKYFGNCVTYYGFCRFSIDMETVNRITIYYKEKTSPPTTTQGAPFKLIETLVYATQERLTKTELIKKEEDASFSSNEESGLSHSINADKEQVDIPFYGIQSNFSNSNSSWLAISGAVGFTERGKNKAPDKTLDELSGHYNAYVFGNAYIPRFRPRFNVQSSKKMIRPSVSLALGTRVSDSFDEVVVGVSIGHLIGKTGIIVGINNIEIKKYDATKDVMRTEREHRWFFGIDYKF